MIAQKFYINDKELCHDSGQLVWQYCTNVDNTTVDKLIVVQWQWWLKSCDFTKLVEFMFCFAAEKD